jgi:hypothetical protein
MKFGICHLLLCLSDFDADHKTLVEGLKIKTSTVVDE